MQEKKSEKPGYDWQWDQPGVRVGDFGAEGLVTSVPKEGAPSENIDTVLSREEGSTERDAAEDAGDVPPAKE